MHINELDLTYENIAFIDEKNVHGVDVSILFKDKLASIDTESTGGVHVFYEAIITILQVFTGQYVLIFDFIKLKSNEIFK